jgi:Brp/Blh family beta-carotene 15,15'-monooxygenase
MGPGSISRIPGARISPGAHRAIRCRVLWPSWLLTAALTLLFASGLTVPSWAEYLPFALSLVLFGLPHGAVDHLAVPRLLGWRPWPWSALAVGLLYLFLGGAYLYLWFATPVAAFATFIALTWLHWGGGDLHALTAFVSNGGAYPVERARRVLALILRGGLPMLIPLLAFPETYRAVAESAVTLFAPASSGVLSWAFEPSFRLIAGAAFALLAVATLASGYRSAKRSESRVAWWIDVAEMALLAAYFALVPPVLAVGLYFCLWHAPRHVARLILLDEKSAGALDAGLMSPSLIRFARDAAPLTIAALVFLLGLYLVAPGTGSQGLSPASLLAVYLVLISVLTLPHVVVVSFMDFRQGLWQRVAPRA